jgi:hypothetical protein
MASPTTARMRVKLRRSPAKRVESNMPREATDGAFPQPSPYVVADLPRPLTPLLDG